MRKHVETLRRYLIRRGYTLRETIHTELPGTPHAFKVKHYEVMRGDIPLQGLSEESVEGMATDERKKIYAGDFVRYAYIGHKITDFLDFMLQIQTEGNKPIPLSKWHHMACRECNTPILQEEVYQRLEPEDGKIALRTEQVGTVYRLVSLGPTSEVITHCPKCGADLAISVGEVNDRDEAKSDAAETKA